MNKEKIRKKIVGFLITGVLVLGLGLTSTPARAELSLGLVGGYDSPNFGEMNEWFDDGFNDPYGTNFEFKAGMLYGLALGLDLPGRFRLRLEYDSFESKTSDGYWLGWPWGESYDAADFKLTVTPVILSVLYGLSPAYIGVGVGSFSTKLDEYWEWEEYDSFGFLVDSGSWSYSESDSPTDLVLLGGFRFGDKPVFLNIEAQHIVGTKAKLDHWSEVDLSGLQLGLLVGIKV
jgi:hypothetical protein